MNNEFIVALIPYLMEEGEFDFYGLSQINGWPEIDYVDQGDGEIIREELDMENYGVVGFTDTTLTMCCGGDWQEPHEVEIALIGEELRIMSCTECNFDDDSDLENQVRDFFSEFTHRNPSEIKRDMLRAVRDEDYMAAARFRDELEELDPIKRRERILGNLLEN